MACKLFTIPGAGYGGFEKEPEARTVIRRRAWSPLWLRAGDLGFGPHYHGSTSRLPAAVLMKSSRSYVSGKLEFKCAQELPTSGASVSFLKKDPLEAREEQQNQRNRKYAILSFCAQLFMLSSTAGAPILGYVWRNWPKLIVHLSQAGLSRYSECFSSGRARRNDSDYGANSASLRHLRSMCLGILLGLIIAVGANSSLAVGPIIDGCLWLALTCSLLFFVGWALRTVVSIVLFVSRGRLLFTVEQHIRSLRRLLLDNPIQRLLNSVGEIGSLPSSMHRLHRSPWRPVASNMSVMRFWNGIDRGQRTRRRWL